VCCYFRSTNTRFTSQKNSDATTNYSDSSDLPVTIGNQHPTGNASRLQPASDRPASHKYSTNSFINHNFQNHCLPSLPRLLRSSTTRLACFLSVSARLFSMTLFLLKIFRRIPGLSIEKMNSPMRAEPRCRTIMHYMQCSS
jgi:hypothetical protein